MSTLSSLSFTAKLTVHISNKWSSYDVCTCSPWGLTVNKTKPPGRVLQEKLGGVCGPIAKALTLFMTKICNIPHHIYDLTLTSKPCFRPAL